MTTGEYLLSVSGIRSGTTLEHLMSLTSGGGVTWLPIQSIIATVENKILDGDILVATIEADLVNTPYSCDVKTRSISGNITQIKIGVDYATS